MSNASTDYESLLLELSPADLARMTPAERALWDSLLPPRPLWSPLPGPQSLAYDSHADILGYGGSAGGGKSALALGLATTRHRRSLILRREATQLHGLLDDARDVLGGLGRFNANTGIWRDLPDGRQIEFGGCANPGDENKYRGRPHDLLVFDEADQFSEKVVRFLSAWLRTTVPGQRTRLLLTFNPPATAEGRWLLTFFGPWLDRKHPRPAAPGELRWYASLPDGSEIERLDGTPFTHEDETITPRSRTFVPARVTDNPFWKGTGYISQLQALPEPLRSQLLYGDMSAGMEDDPWQIVPTAWVEAAQARWRPTPPEGSRLDAVGVDVARGGKDQTLLAPRWAAWFAPLQRHPGSTTPDGPAVVALVLKAVAANPRALVCMDVIGVGASPYDWGKATGLLPGLWAVDFRQGTDARDSSGRLGFANLRAYAYWSFREALDPASGLNVQLPPDRELLADLTAPRWKLTMRGVQVEDKDEVKKRIGRSPDAADAVVTAALFPPDGGGERAPSGQVLRP